MNCTWLGQAGLLFEKGSFRILIDPYFSDSVERINPKNFRRQAVDPRFLELQPDVLIFTHSHLDHFDPETVSHYLSENSSVLVLAPSSVWGEVRKIGGENNFVLFDEGTSWTEKGIRFSAVKAEHSDPSAIGVIIDDGEKKHYVTGDTLYNEKIFCEIPCGIDTVFLPVNGVGNNMNMTDAAHFAKRIGAKKVVPIHVGMFDSVFPEDFDCENRYIASVYEAFSL